MFTYAHVHLRSQRSYKQDATAQLRGKTTAGGVIGRVGLASCLWASSGPTNTMRCTASPVFLIGAQLNC